MASQVNFFALLDDDENDDPSVLIAKMEAASLSDLLPKGVSKQQQQQKTEPLQRQQPQANFPSKPLPPSQAARGNQSSVPDGSDGRGGRGGGRGSFGNNRGRGRGYQGEPRGSDFSDNNNNVDAGEFQGNRRGYYGGGRPYYENGDAPPSGDDNQGRRMYDGGRGRGGRGRGQGRSRGFENAEGDSEDNFMRKREYDRRSGTGRGVEMKRNGAGRGNWGTDLDPTVAAETPEKEPPVEEEKPVSESAVKKTEEEGVTAEEKTTDEPKEEEKEEEAKEMTLDEYEIVLIEKRKALEAMKAQERKVKPDKEFESMQIVNKKQDDDSVMKLVTDNDKGKRKEMLEKEEKARKAMSINEFLKPADGQEYFSPASRRGRGRGRGDRGGFRGGFVDGSDSNSPYHVSAPVIEDRSQFPSLLAK